MMNQLKQLNDARKMAKNMEEKMKNSPVNLKQGCVSLQGNLKKIEEIIIDSEETNMSKIQKDIMLVVNKYIEHSESEKQKIMHDSLGGMSGMMNMLKGIKG